MSAKVHLALESQQHLLGSSGAMFRNGKQRIGNVQDAYWALAPGHLAVFTNGDMDDEKSRSEEHTSELQSRQYLVCRLLLEKKNTPQVTDALRMRGRAASHCHE